MTGARLAVGRPVGPGVSFLDRGDGFGWLEGCGSALMRFHPVVIASAHGQFAWIFRRRASSAAYPRAQRRDHAAECAGFRDSANGAFV